MSLVNFVALHIRQRIVIPVQRLHEDIACMNEFGQWLRNAREAQGLSLAEVEAITRIRQRFLAAIEAEEWSILPNEVTARGFLRKYAAFLGLDVDTAMQRYQETTGPEPEEDELLQVAEEREVDYRPIELNLSKPSLEQIEWQPVVSVLVVIVLLALVVWAVVFLPGGVSSLASRLPESLPEPADLLAIEATPSPTPTRVVIRVTATPALAPESSSPESSTPAVTAAAVAVPASNTSAQTDIANRPAEGLQLHLAISQRSWVRVTVDGQVRLETVLEPGEQGDWQAQETIGLRTGNAAGVQVSVNEQEQAPLGSPGEVVELQWRLDNGQVVVSTPTPTPTEPAPPEGVSIAAASKVISTTATSTTGEAEAPSTSEVVAVAAAQAEGSRATPTPSAAPTIASPSAVVAQAGDQVAVRVQITEPSWIRVTVDGQKQLETILEPGTDQSWQGKRSVHLRIGNAGGVQLTINGQRRGSLGKSGEVVDLVWQLEDNGQVIEVTPTPQAASPAADHRLTASSLEG